jgi:acyl-CoA synthetase (AMP-forming)/AMP-acid ligase II
MASHSAKFENNVTSVERARSYRGAGYWTEATLSDAVGQVARTNGERTAVVDHQGSRRHSYQQLNDDALTLATFLEGQGVGPGSVISIQLPNTYESVVTAVAAQTLGGIINPLLTNYRAHELEHVFATASPAAIFTPGDYRDWHYGPMVAGVAVKTNVHPIHVVVDDDVHDGDAQWSDILADSHARHDTWLQSRAKAREVSEVIFTSGTESTPKAVMHTEETTNFAVRTAFEDLSIGPDQVVWMPSPVGHSTGFNYGTRAALVHGRTLLLQDRWSASDAIEMIKRFDGSYTLAATTFLQDLVEECERMSVRLDEMSHFSCGGAPVPPELVQRAQAIGIDVLRLYGSTEALCGTWNRPTSPQEKKMTTDGPALSHTDIALGNEYGDLVDGADEGELHLRGPNTSVGYFNDPERTAASYLDGGWVRSGDLARLDDEGFLTVVGRKKEIIIRGGLNIAPREIEDLLITFPEIERVAVVGIPSERLGEQSCACVVLRTGQSLDLATMTSRLRQAGLATFKLPESMRIMSKLPATASGKVQKHEILRQIESELSNAGRESNERETP